MISPSIRRLVAYAGAAICVLTSLPACVVDDGVSEPPPGADTYRPVYGSLEEIRRVQATSPQPLKNPGKIYVKDHFIFVNEITEGIHVIDNRDPAAPQPISFIRIPGNVDMAVRNNVLYADNTIDLVAIDITDPTALQLLSRVQDVFPAQSYPPPGSRFECPDPAKGVVVRWEKADVKEAKCFR